MTEEIARLEAARAALRAKIAHKKRLLIEKRQDLKKLEAKRDKIKNAIEQLNNIISQCSSGSAANVSSNLSSAYSLVFGKGSDVVAVFDGTFTGISDGYSKVAGLAGQDLDYCNRELKKVEQKIKDKKEVIKQLEQDIRNLEAQLANL